MTTPALHAAVRRAYAVFGGRTAPNDHLNVCTICSSCMPPELEWEMRNLPLRSLTARHFYKYGDGVMGDGLHPAEEIRYLLPRWLELIAAGEEVHSARELSLERLGRCQPGTFDQEETNVLEEFMLALFRRQLDEVSSEASTENLKELVIMFDVAGLEVPLLLRHWTSLTDLASTLWFARFIYSEFLPTRALSNGFPEVRPALQAKFKAWLEAPETRAAFCAKLLKPDFLAFAEQSSERSTLSLALMAEPVFDYLSE